MFFLVITGFTTGNHIAFIAFPSPGKWYNMIHGQILRAAFLLTIVADARSQLVMPPGGTSQISSFFPFPGNMPFIFIDMNPVRHKNISSRMIVRQQVNGKLFYGSSTG